MQHSGYDCVSLQNDFIELLVTKSIGPRIISLRLPGGKNLFAELPDSISQRPDGKDYHFYGGHRLWISPEDPIRSYGMDDKPVEINPLEGGLSIRKAVEPESGFEKTLQLKLHPDRSRVTISHKLTNRSEHIVECAVWAITQFLTGGVAILPQSQIDTGLLPNRIISLWPYTDVSTSRLHLGNQFVLIQAEMDTPFKIGFANPRGWLAYWLNGTLFVKRAAYDPQRQYGDFNSSSECYCNQDFLELETLSPLELVKPGMTITHQETWDLYSDIAKPENESAVQKLVEASGLS